MFRYILEMLPESNSLKKIYNKRRRVRNIYKRKKCIPEYLKDNNFEVELNYKLWVTKGARFKASERCEAKYQSFRASIRLLYISRLSDSNNRTYRS